MRMFSYEGDHAEVTLYGVTFPQSQPVEVADAFLLKKLEGNNHFKEHAAVTPEPVAPPVIEPEPAQEAETTVEAEAQAPVVVRKKPGRKPKAA